MNGQSFRTHHTGLASFLRYTLGESLHVSTTVDNGVPTFAFDNYGRCKELTDAFFGEGGAAVADALALLECNREIKMTVTAARRSPHGLWTIGDEFGGNSNGSY